MGGAQSVEKKSSPTVQFPVDGLTITAVNDFIKENGGKETFSELTTREVCEKYILPLTAGKKVSFCEQLKADGKSGAVGKAAVYVAHAWDNKFLDVILALNHHFQAVSKPVAGTDVSAEDAKDGCGDGSDTIIWFDIFSKNQHIEDDFSEEWWSTTFKKAIEQVGNMVLVLPPSSAHSISPFSRSKCLYELYCASATNCKFNIAMSLKEQEHFLETICKDYTRIMNKLVGDIDIRSSSCTSHSQREKIMSVVSKDIGLEHLNDLVAKIVRNWVLEMLKKASADLNRSSSVVDTVVGNGSGSDLSGDNERWSFVAAIQSDPKAVLLARLASTSVMIEQGSCEDAISALGQLSNEFHSGTTPENKKALTGATLSERDVPFMCSVHCNFAAANMKKGDYEKALECYQNALAILEDPDGGGSSSALAATSSSAAATRPGSSGTTPSRSGSANGSISPRRTRYTLKIAHTNSNMGDVCVQMEDHQEALRYYQRALDLLVHYYGSSGGGTGTGTGSPGNNKKALPSSHGDIATAHENLAKVFESMEDYTPAVEHYNSALRIRISCETETHPSVGRLHTWLGVVHFKQQEYDQALAEFATAMSILHNSVGDGHPFVAETLRSIAELKHTQNRTPEAIEDFKKALDIYVNLYGQNHESVSSVHLRMGEVHDAARQHKQALDHYQAALDIQTVLFGDEHPSTANIHHSIAACYSNLGKFTDALVVHSKTLKIRLQAAKTDDHPTVATTYANLGLAYCGLSDYTTALVYCEQSLKIRQSKLGEDHPDTKSIYDIVQQLRAKKLHREASKKMPNSQSTGSLSKVREEDEAAAGGAGAASTPTISPAQRSRRE